MNGWEPAPGRARRRPRAHAREGDASAWRSSASSRLEGLEPVLGPGGLFVLEGPRQLPHQTLEHRLHHLLPRRRQLDKDLAYPHPFRDQLDEPTNNLDLATKEMLIEALKSFEGSMLFVSHDCRFLSGFYCFFRVQVTTRSDRVATCSISSPSPTITKS